MLQAKLAEKLVSCALPAAVFTVAGSEKPSNATTLDWL
jgi:hypothetical protein